MVLRVPASAVSALDMVVWPVGGRSHVGDELGGAACGEASCSRYGAREREQRGWGGAGGHGDHVGADGVARDERWWRRGSAAVLGEDDVEEDEAGLASARGSGCSTESTTAELLDTVAPYGDDGGCGFTVARAQQRRPWRRESEGERQESE